MSSIKRITRADSGAAKSPTKTEATLRHSSRNHAKDKLRNITNTILMSTGEDPGTGAGPPPKKKKKINPNSTAQQCIPSSQPSSSQSKLCDKLLFVLGRNYFDVCQRLSLDYVPRCVRNISDCAQHHANKRSPPTKCVNSMRQVCTLDQLVEHRPDQFLEFLNQAIMRREFLDSELFIAGLQLMLTINEPSKELRVNYSADDIVTGMGEMLERCLEHFPPCRWDLRSAFHEVLMGDLDAPCFKECDLREGLLRNVLHLIEHNIETEVKQEGKRRAATDKRIIRHALGDKTVQDYHTWVSIHRMRYDFDRLSRVERFHRLFAVLQVLVKLLEMDLAMWILRNPTKTQQHLCNPSRGPLVARLVWNGDYGSVNLVIKKLFQLFINMNALQYPQEDITIVSRLLNLVTVAVNLSEFQHNDGEIVYPCVKDNSQHYARQLWKTLETSSYFSIPLCLRTIRTIRSPFLRVRLIEHLLQKFNRSTKLSNVSSFFQQLHDRAWLECSEEEPEQAGAQSSTTSYPVLNAQRTRAKTSEIHRRQYVELLLIGLRAYCDMHQLPAYFRELMTRPEQSETDVDERLIFRGIALSGELVADYRNDIKYLLLIEQNLKKIKEVEERALLHDWIAFLAEIDPSFTTG
uniref:Uncharacterized protein n=1 Tax=Anopheles epiroticus TaxID=199890 RepID=A0A182PUS7_9DIPT